MPKLSNYQIDEMDAAIQTTMNLRMKLTKIGNTVEEVSDSGSDNEDDGDLSIV